MNKINFTNTGGFPFDQDTLKKMQEAYSTLQALGGLAGSSKAIISGCQTTGSVVSEGFVFVDGELLYFEGGTVGASVIIEETVEKVEYKDGLQKEAFITRKVRFGSGVNSMLWNDFKRAFPLTSAVFVDEVRMYAGDINNLPFGWYLCDGTNNTVDLKGKFIAGFDSLDSDYDSIGKTGGSKNRTLSPSNLPKVNTNLYVGQDGVGYPNGSGDTTTAGTPHSYVRNTKKLKTEDFGANDQSFDIRPPFYVLAYIQFKGI